ncbi:MAG TPA: glycine zipper domain-containing protein [Lacunisphaera sp.]|nr:glycine zipper domain-containing protein [Lacunisphaera sp.]
MAPSKTASGAGTGAAAGAVVGAVANPTGNSGQGILAGAAAGAIIGGIIGLTQEMKERKEQDRLAQERAYQQDLSKTRSAEAKAKAEMDEELAVAQGFRISDMELNEAQKKVDDASGRLAKLREERNAALSKKKALDEAQEKLLTTEAEVARLEEELARLRGEQPSQKTTENQTTTPAPQKTPRT